MLEFSERRKIRRAIYSKPVAAVLCILVAFLAYAAYGMYKTASESEARREMAAIELTELQGRETFLKTEIARLKTPRGVEEEVREKFDVAKEGEKVIVIVEEEKKKEEVLEEKGWFSKFTEWFTKEE